MEKYGGNLHPKKKAAPKGNIGGAIKQVARVHYTPPARPQQVQRQARRQATRAVRRVTPNRPPAAPRKPAHARRAKQQRETSLFRQALGAKGIGQFGLGTMFVHPTKLARSNYSSLAEQVFPRLHLGGKRPKLVFDAQRDRVRTPGGSGAAAYVIPGKNEVHVSPTTVLGQQFGPKAMQDYDRLVLPHEFAHARQSKRTYKEGVPSIEGGADDFAKYAGRRAYKQAGVRTPGWRPNKEYAPYRKFVLQKKGKGWILKGQFGG
jgi:hypothetical protein